VLAAALGFWIFSVVHWKQGVWHVDWESALHDNVEVTNEFVNFLPRGLSFLLEPPYERHPTANYWEALFRTSLFGEFTSDNPDMSDYASGALVITLAFLVFIGLGFVQCVAEAWRTGGKGHLELLLTFVGFLGSVLLFRVRFPFFPHNDFRFALPIIVPCGAMAAMGFAEFRRRFAVRRPHLAALPAWLVVFFCFLSTRILFVW
jgi:hypothetical protein